MLVLRFNLDLIIPRKAVHEGKHLATRTLIQNMINKWCGEVILRTGSVQVSEIYAYIDCSSFFSTKIGFDTYLVKGMR